MNDLPHRALLPAGFHDTLPPHAAREAAVVERLVAILGSFGYERVKPPLLEFEDTLFAGVGADMADETFRLMDPQSRRMIGLRADTTPQIARIAGSRLARAPRPLRLAYAGQVLRVRGTQLRPERQFTQVGGELIGTGAAEADAEVAILAATALIEAGVRRLTLDLNVPTLVPALLEALAVPAGVAAELRGALDRKDAARVAALAHAQGGRTARLLPPLLEAAGAAAPTLERVRSLGLPDAAAAELQRLIAVVGLIGRALPALGLTVDLVEHRGFEYQTGVSFTLFGHGVRGELGRGGRYVTDPVSGPGGVHGPEPATGFTLYMDSVLRALPAPAPPRRLFLPFGTDPAVARQLREEGQVAVAGMHPVDDEPAEARRLGCHARLDGSRIVPVNGGEAP